MSKHRFDARSWRIIKEYAGVYGIMNKDDFEKLYKLPVEQLNNVCGKELGFKAQDIQVRWEHMIPEDPQRNPAKHVIGHTGAHDLCRNVNNRMWGHGHYGRGYARYSAV